MDQSLMSKYNLKDLLRSIVSDQPDPSAVTALVNVCHKIALAYLRVKSSSSKFDATRFGLTIDDFAYDAIAELFGRDTFGSYSTFRSFVQRIGSIDQQSDNEIASSLRPIVFGAVNQRIFRMYGLYDPGLSKIIRNIKLALKNHPSVSTSKYLGDTMIVPRDDNSLQEHLPPPVPELFSPDFYECLTARSSLKDMLDILGDVLRRQTSYRKMIALVEAALLIRSAYASDVQMKPEEEPGQTLSQSEVHGMISETVKRLEHNTARSYLRKGKLNAHELESHLCAIRDVLLAEFVWSDGQSSSYYEIMKRYLNWLTPELYHRKHRVVLEYLSKLARRDLISRLKSEL